MESEREVAGNGDTGHLDILAWHGDTKRTAIIDLKTGARHWRGLAPGRRVSVAVGVSGHEKWPSRATSRRSTETRCTAASYTCREWR